MSRLIIPVILSGGAGTRLWPLSRESHPKQFLSPAGELTLLQGTARRLAAIEHLAAPIVVCNDAHRFIVSQQLGAVGVTPAALVLEPVARDTAPAIAAAALEALARREGDADPILLILPCDHVITDEPALARAVRDASIEAASGKLVTFGVAPEHPETRYGYIKAGAPTGLSHKGRWVERFVEKPDARTATAWLEDGRYYWNSGMFAWRARRYLEEIGLHARDIRDAVVIAHRKAEEDLGFLRLDADSFAGSPGISVDHAIMERASGAAMIPLEAGWSDIGSWAALRELGEPDVAGNVAHGDVLFERTRDTYVSGTGRLVATLGVAGLVIADTADAVLVADKRAVQDVGKVVARLESAGRDEARRHRTVHRPWGVYNVLHIGDGFKVKHIAVAPGQRLSLQSHRRRAEHWVVVRGVARVTRADEVYEVSESQSTSIAPGVRHRLENPGVEPLELVEIQIGGYLGEDDIVRHEDSYGRAESRAQSGGEGRASTSAPRSRG